MKKTIIVSAAILAITLAFFIIAPYILRSRHDPVSQQSFRVAIEFQRNKKETGELLKFWEKNTETKNGGALYFSKEPVRIYGKKSYYMIHESGEIRAIQKNVSD